MPGPKTVTDFEFPSSFGFTGSASDGPQLVRSYERQKPQRFAQGGKVARKGPPPLPTREALGSQTTERERAALQTKLPKRRSPVDIMRGKTRREQERALGLQKGGKVEIEIEFEGEEEENEVENKQRGGPVVKGHMRRSIPHKSSYESKPHSHMKGGGTLRKAMGGPIKAARGGMDRPVSMPSDPDNVTAPAAKRGGRVRFAKGGDMAQDRRLVKQEMTKHIRAPKPRGHGVK